MRFNLRLKIRKKDWSNVEFQEKPKFVQLLTVSLEIDASSTERKDHPVVLVAIDHNWLTELVEQRYLLSHRQFLD